MLKYFKETTVKQLYSSVHTIWKLLHCTYAILNHYSWVVVCHYFIQLDWHCIVSSCYVYTLSKLLSLPVSLLANTSLNASRKTFILPICLWPVNFRQWSGHQVLNFHILRCLLIAFFHCVYSFERNFSQAWIEWRT